MKRYLIVTADDFGFSKERNQGIAEAFKKSAVKSASLLLNCTGTLEAAEYFKTNSICPGLHLNLTEGPSISQKQHSTLTDPSGRFWGKLELRQLLESGKIDSQEIQHEIQSQIDFFIKLVGRKPSYVDGHQHIHVHPDVANLFASALHDNGIFVTRFPVELALGRKTWVKQSVMEFYLDVMSNARACRPVYDSKGIRCPDTYVGFSTMGGNMSVERLQSSILEAFQHAEESKNEGKTFVSCELMTHPGYRTDRYGGGFDGCSDDFGCSAEREHEIGILTSKQMADFYEDHEIILAPHEILI